MTSQKHDRQGDGIVLIFTPCEECAIGHKWYIDFFSQSRVEGEPTSGVSIGGFLF